MSVWDRRKEILYGNGSIGEVSQNNPTPGCVVNGTGCYDSWLWVFYFIYFYRRLQSPRARQNYMTPYSCHLRHVLKAMASFLEVSRERCEPAHTIYFYFYDFGSLDPPDPSNRRSIWSGLTTWAARYIAGESRPKRRVEVGGLGKTKDLRGRAGRRTLPPRATRCYNLDYENWLTWLFIIRIFYYYELTKFQQQVIFHDYIFGTAYPSKNKIVPKIVGNTVYHNHSISYITDLPTCWLCIAYSTLCCCVFSNVFAYH